MRPDPDEKTLPRRHFSTGTRNGIIAGFQAGADHADLAKKYDISLEAVRKILEHVKRRDGGFPSHLTHTEIAKVIETRDRGESFVTIAQNLGATYHTVYKAYRREGA